MGFGIFEAAGSSEGEGTSNNDVPAWQRAGDPTRMGHAKGGGGGKSAGKPGLSLGELLGGRADRKKPEPEPRKTPLRDLIHEGRDRRNRSRTNWTGIEAPKDGRDADFQGRAAEVAERGNRGQHRPGGGASRGTAGPIPQSSSWLNRRIDKALERADARAERKAAKNSDAPPSGDRGWSRGGAIIVGGLALTRAMMAGGDHSGDVGSQVPDQAEITGGTAAVGFAETSNPFLVAEPPRELGALTITAVQLDMPRRDLAA